MNNSLIIKRIKEVLKKKGSSFALHEPYFDRNEINELKKCIKSGYVSTIGNYVKKFENKKSKVSQDQNILFQLSMEPVLYI